jgi:hypothetical protein
MIRKLCIFGFGLAASIAALQAAAHHSFAATYKEDQTITIEGTLVQFLFRNPHSFVHVEVKDDKGQVTTWAVEWGAPRQLGLTGVERDGLKPGDPVIVIGNPGRNPTAHRMRLVNIKRTSDGWTWNGAFD